MSCFKAIAFILASLTLPQAALAAHLGTLGPTYPVGEDSALDMIMQKLRDKEKSGELKKIEEAAKRRALHSITTIPPLAGLTTVTTRSQRLIDPSVTYKKAVTTDTGQIVIPAGTTINPLDIMPLSKRLVFFDGRDAEQCEAVRRLVKQYARGIKPILVGGSWLDLSKAWKTQVYVDQRGTLVERFGIHAVPTIIRQQGKALLLEEIPAKELR